MKAFYIDSERKMVEEIEYFGLSDLQDRIGGSICLGHHYPNGDVVYVHDEGRFRFGKGFVIAGQREPLFGPGMLVGAEMTDEDTTGDGVPTCDPTITLVQLIGSVTFWTIQFMPVLVPDISP